MARLTIGTAKDGAIVEIMASRYGRLVATGQIYKLGPARMAGSGRREAWSRWGQGIAYIFPGHPCRDLSRDPELMTERF